MCVGGTETESEADRNRGRDRDRPRQGLPDAVRSVRARDLALRRRGRPARQVRVLGGSAAGLWLAGIESVFCRCARACVRAQQQQQQQQQQE